MSMHRVPLTDLERSGLRAHGLPIGTPSQLSDVFRQGIRFAVARGTNLRTFFDSGDAYNTERNFTRALATLDTLYHEQPDTEAGTQNKVDIESTMSFLRHLKRTIQGS